MRFTALRQPSQVLLNKRWSVIGLPASSLLLAVSTSIACAPSASAIETITLVFNESRVSVPFSDFETFVKTGEAQRENLQKFLARVPNTSQAVRTVMTREIAITRPFTEQNFKNLFMNFLLVQLSTILGSSAASEDLSPLRTAVVASYRNDQRISLLEVMENYPATEIVVQFPRLERAYNRVSALVERVRPGVETAQQFLQDLLCDCPKSSSSSFDQQTVAVGVASPAKDAKCP
jgi:hypothetical protein